MVIFVDLRPMDTDSTALWMVEVTFSLGTPAAPRGLVTAGHSDDISIHQNLTREPHHLHQKRSVGVTRSVRILEMSTQFTHVYDQNPCCH